MKRPPGKSSIRHLLLLLESDRRRYKGGWIQSRGFWATAAYRVRRARKGASLFVKVFLIPVESFLAIVKFQVTDAEIPASANIGSGLYLPHPQGVVICQNARIGSHVSIFQQVTLANWNGGWPRIRARASIFAGAKIIGSVIVGRSTFVGANAVVTKDIPDWHVAMGVPATVKLRKGG